MMGLGSHLTPRNPHTEPQVGYDWALLAPNYITVPPHITVPEVQYDWIP